MTNLNTLLGNLARFTGKLDSQLDPILTQMQIDLKQAGAAFQEAAESTADTVPTGAIREIRLGPGSLASYLEETGIAVAAGPNEVDYLDLHHWAEPLGKGISRTLGENREQQLGSVQITVYPDPFLAETGYEVQYTTDRSEGTLEGSVTLEVTWRVEKRPGGSVLASQRSVITVSPVGGAKGPDAYVERLSQAVALWSKEIATAIQGKTQPRE